MIADFVKYSFLQNSLIVGMILGILLPLIGLIVLMRKMPNIADALGHINMSGIAFVYCLNSIIVTSFTTNTILIIMWTICGAILIEFFRTKYEHNKEVAIMIVYSIAVALTMIFMSISSGFQSSLFNILFGNINTISTSERNITIMITVLIIIIFKVYYKKMMILALDNEVAKLHNIKIRFTSYLIMTLLAVIITIAIKILGILIVTALLLIPLLSAIRVTNSLKKTMILAIIFTEISLIGGIFIGYSINIATSAVIVLISVTIYLITLIIPKY